MSARFFRAGGRSMLSVSAHVLGAAGGGVTSTTWDPSNKAANIALTGSNLIATESYPGYDRTKVRAIAGKTTGKWYIEATVGNVGQSNEWSLALCNASEDLNSGPLSGSTSTSYQSNGFVGANSISIGPYTTFAAGTVIGMAVDLDNNRMAWRRNGGAWENSANISTGSGMVDISFLTGTKYPVLQLASNDGSSPGQGTINASATPPSGFTLWG